MSIVDLYSKIEEAQKSWDDLYGLLASAHYPLDSAKPALSGLTLAEFDRKVRWLFELLNAIRPSDEQDVAWLVLSVKTAVILSQLNTFTAHVASSLVFLRQHWRDNLTAQDPTGNLTIQLLDGPNGIANQDASGNFIQINGSTNELIANISQLMPLCRADGSTDLSSRAQAMAQLVRDLEGLRDRAGKLLIETQQSATAADERAKTAQAIGAQAEATNAKVQALQQQATSDAANVIALITQIKTIGASAQSLEQQVTTYQAKFENFQAELDNRLKQFADFEANTRSAADQNNERATEIDRLTKLADSMISGATTAGLATSLEGTRARYEKRMVYARQGFYVAVGLLILSALPLVAHLMPGLLGGWLPASSANQEETTPYAVLGKIILLLPASWLTAFFAKSYAEHFHLEREYAHKAALAESIDGFKRQAPTYQEEITAEVFMEIRSNPTSRRGPEPAAHPLYDVLTKAVSKVLSKDEKNDTKSPS